MRYWQESNKHIKLPFNPQMPCLLPTSDVRNIPSQAQQTKLGAAIIGSDSIAPQMHHTMAWRKRLFRSGALWVLCLELSPWLELMIQRRFELGKTQKVVVIWQWNALKFCVSQLQPKDSIIVLVPSGKHTKNWWENHYFSWVNPLFLWPFSIVFSMFTRPGISQNQTPKNLAHHTSKMWQKTSIGIIFN